MNHLDIFHEAFINSTTYQDYLDYISTHLDDFDED